jgi:hypothetical protein
MFEREIREFDLPYPRKYVGTRMVAIVAHTRRANQRRKLAYDPGLIIVADGDSLYVFSGAEGAERSISPVRLPFGNQRR